MNHSEVISDESFVFVYFSHNCEQSDSDVSQEGLTCSR